VVGAHADRERNELNAIQASAQLMVCNLLISLCPLRSINLHAIDHVQYLQVVLMNLSLFHFNSISCWHGISSSSHSFPQSVITSAAHELLSMPDMLLEGFELCEYIHAKGINCRWLGRLAEVCWQLVMNREVANKEAHEQGNVSMKLRTGRKIARFRTNFKHLFHTRYSLFLQISTVQISPPTRTMPASFIACSVILCCN
jgi:hypothetical protein